MDPVQILLIIILALSTFFLTIVGVQLIITLRQLQNTLKQISKVVEGFESMGVGMSQSFQEIIGFMNGFKVVTRAINLFTQTKNETKNK
ncbi:MAG: hypothetical protein N2691_00500 [Patescibacteria group bacterium]|nr:hypothetical protein [Patescibacteria group bacterium]